MKANLNRILNSREFQPETQEEGFVNRAARWLQEKWEQLKNWLRRIFGGRQISGAGASLGAPVVYAIVIALVVAMAVLIARAIPFQFRRKKAEASELKAIDEDEEEPLVVEPEPWLLEAQERAKAGDYRGAERAVFIASLMQLDKAGLLTFERARTNGDYLRTLRFARWKAAYDLLLPFASRFEQHWYGRVDAHESDYTLALRDYDALKQQNGSEQNSSEDSTVAPTSAPLAAAPGNG